MSRASSARRTKVSTDLLHRMFQSTTSESRADSESIAPRQLSTASQTMVSSIDLIFFDELVGPNASGKIHSAAHSLDRQELTRLRTQHICALVDEEAARRELLLEAEMEVRRAHAAHTRTLRHISESLLRNPFVFSKGGGGGGGARLLHTTSSSGAISPVDPRTPSFPVVPLDVSTDFARFGPQSTMTFDNAVDVEEMDKLKAKVQELEHKVRANAKANISSIASPSRTLDLFTRAVRSNTTAANALAATQRLVQCSMDEATTRSWIRDSGEKGFLIIKQKWSIAYLEHRLSKASRIMVHAPFTSYRPKIPIEHSLAGEEYLRRWILVETLAHYEDCLTLLQRHENDVRNGIEEEHAATIKNLYEEAMFPYYVNHCAELEITLDEQNRWAEHQRRNANAIHATLQLQVLVEHESSVREQYEKWEHEEIQWLSKISLELSEVRSVYHTVRSLEQQFRRQRDRHSAEVQCLVAQLPKDGVIHTKFQWEKCFPAEEVRQALSPSVPSSPRQGSAARRTAPSSMSPSRSTTTDASPRAAYWAGF